jgi:hypothetical protein
LNDYNKIIKNVILKKDLFDIFYYEYYKYKCIFNLAYFTVSKHLFIKQKNYINKYKKIDKTKNTKILLR